MIASFPAVTLCCKKARRYICYSPRTKRSDKRVANRRHRRYLNLVTRSFINDPELFDCEGFDAPTFTSWEIW